MNAQKTGQLIYKLRTQKKLTQKEFADAIGVTDKAVCKWEKGNGCPDITLLNNISKVLEVDIQSIIQGELCKSITQGGNMKKIKIFRCCDCGNLVTSTNNVELSCCGNKLQELKVINLNDYNDTSSDYYIPLVKEYDNQYSVSFNHPMTKENYISNIITISYNQLTVINLFAQQEAIVTIPQITGIKIIVVTNKNLALEIK